MSTYIKLSMFYRWQNWRSYLSLCYWRLSSWRKDSGLRYKMSFFLKISYPIYSQRMIENNLSKHWNLFLRNKTLKSSDPFCTFDSGEQLGFRYFEINSWIKWLIKYVYRFIGLNGPCGINCYFHWPIQLCAARVSSFLFWSYFLE